MSRIYLKSRGANASLSQLSMESHRARSGWPGTLAVVLLTVAVVIVACGMRP